MINILIVLGITLLVAICIAGTISSGVMAKPNKTILLVRSSN
ncbi:MAG TPA: hypothetical protein VJR94_10805 [Candidatus Nitrosocosmicus sp.]|nr:hypothetical protein [Candidatus Nitrosocosmicus sp.]